MSAQRVIDDLFAAPIRKPARQQASVYGTGAHTDPDATRYVLGAMAALDSLARGCTVALLRKG